MTVKTRISRAGLVAFAASCANASSTSSTSSTASATHPCDPLTVDAAPIALGTLVAAGKSAADGTVYVLDRGPVGTTSGVRAFVSDGSVLRRRNVAGTGEGADFVIATVDDPAGRLDVRVDIANGSATHMAITRNGPDPGSKTFVGGEELVLLAVSDLSTFTLANIAGVRVTYAATASDGHRFYAFEPTIDNRQGALRAFYGTADRVVERRVLSESRDLTIHLEIDLDGVPTLVQLNSCGENPYFGPTRLQPEGAPAILLTPMPGALSCPILPEAGTDAGADGGSDAGAYEFTPRADDTTLVSGATFVCFGG